MHDMRVFLGVCIMMGLKKHSLISIALVKAITLENACNCE